MLVKVVAVVVIVAVVIRSKCVVGGGICGIVSYGGVIYG